LNASVARVDSNLESAPQLLDLPKAVGALETHVAKLGSKLNDLEATVAKDGEGVVDVADVEVRAVLLISLISANIGSPILLRQQAALTRQANATAAIRRTTDELGAKLERIRSEVNVKLQEDEASAAKSWVIKHLIKHLMTSFTSFWAGVDSQLAKRLPDLELQDDVRRATDKGRRRLFFDQCDDREAVAVRHELDDNPGKLRTHHFKPFKSLSH